VINLFTHEEGDMAFPEFFFNGDNKIIHAEGHDETCNLTTARGEGAEGVDKGDFNEAVRRHNEEGYRACGRCLQKPQEAGAEEPPS